MFVFFNARNARIKLSIDSDVVGYYDDADELYNAFVEYGVTLDDDLLFSSDVDFASEEGFATDACAHKIIDAAVAQLK
jgi:hypothetical protein